jgi:hypothetical protein
LSIIFFFKLRDDALRVAVFFAGEESAAVVLLERSDFVRVVVEAAPFVEVEELFLGRGAGVGVPGEEEARLVSALPFVAGVDTFFLEEAEVEREGVADCRLQARDRIRDD